MKKNTGTVEYCNKKTRKIVTIIESIFESNIFEITLSYKPSFLFFNRLHEICYLTLR
jgi:hypothetical protein